MRPEDYVEHRSLRKHVRRTHRSEREQTAEHDDRLDGDGGLTIGQLDGGVAAQES